MLRRAALPLLRQRPLTAAVRRSLAHPYVRSYANKNEPLRRVPSSPNERIDPKPINRSFSIPDPAEPPRPSSDQISNQQDRVEEPHDSTTFSESNRPSESSKSAEPSTSEAESPSGPTGPLPDLTKGIPSTLAAELAQAQKARGETKDDFNITEDPASPPPSGSGGRSTDGLPRSEYVSSSDRRRSAAVKYIYSGVIFGTLGYLLYLGRDWDNEEERKLHREAPDGWSPGNVYKRIQARIGSTMSYYQDPVMTKLLPDEELDPNLRGALVLVISLEDMLVHSEWTRATGWRIAKRPGVDYFLRYLSQYYELVLFTSQPSFVAEQIWLKLDPYSITRPLFREHTLYKDGGYVKDLSYLNRDLKKVIVMDTDAHHVKNQPENAIIIPKWTGDPNDQTLVQFIPFLEYLATMGFDDTRTVLKSFEGKYIPAEFAEREKALRKKLESKNAEKRKPKSGGLGLGSLFGARSQPQDGMQATGDAQTEGKMIWDHFREQGQKNYEALEKKIREEGATWLAERDAENKRLQEEGMANLKSGMFGWFGSGSSNSSDK